MSPVCAASRQPVARIRTATALLLAFLLTLASIVAVDQPHAAAQPLGTTPDLTSLVDPFVSTSGDHGNDLPGAQAPNSLVKVNPMTSPGRSHSGYDYAQTNINGFTQTNLDGVGGSGAGGDFLVVPTSVAYDARPSVASYAHPFTHDDEHASPGYYQVGLGAIAGKDGAITHPDGKIAAEMTTTTRTALHRYTFPAGQTPSLVIDLANNFTQRNASDLTTTPLGDGRLALAGSFTGFFNGATYKLYYYAETEQKVVKKQTWADGTTLADTATRRGRDTGAVLTFDTADRTIGLRVTLSPISTEQAKVDQAAELGSKTFDQVRQDTEQAWNRMLQRVNITASDRSDPTGELRKLFYTHLYRMFALPINATSTSGTYRGVDGSVHKVDNYTYYDGWSSWDDFRKYSVIAYVAPDIYQDIIQSLITRMADQATTGSSDVFAPTQGVPNVRYERSAVIVADALSKGYTGFSRLAQAYPVLRDLTGYYTGQQLRQGFIADRPGDMAQRGYDQWALAIIADAVGRTNDAAALRKQALLPLANQYKPGAWTAPDGTKVGLLTPRDSSGNWTNVDYEQFQAANLYQGTLWQYNWYPAYDMAGLIKATGGQHATELALRELFGEDDPDNGRAMLHSNANEIDLQAPYLFNYVNEPALTQKWVRAIYTKQTWNRYIATGQTDGNNPPSGNGEFTPPVRTKVYQLAPEGFLPTMDNDAGTMSTMFVAAALGMFPVTAGSSQYQLGTPFFDSATISYPSGRNFTVSAANVTPDNFYVQSAKLNGRGFHNTWIDFSTITGGGSLDLSMGAQPSTWGSDSAPAYSLSNPATGKPQTYPVTADHTTVAAAADGKLAGGVKLTFDRRVKLAARVGTDLLRQGSARVIGLPQGAKASVTVTGSSTVALGLSGRVSTEAQIWIEFTDAAFRGGVKVRQITGQGVSATSPITLSVAAADRAALQALVGEGLLERQGNYSVTSYRAFTAALARARAVLDDPAAAGADLRAAKEYLQSAADTLTLNEGGYRVLQAEQSDEWSGPPLNNQAYMSAGNLGGVTDGSWIRYLDLDFTGTTPKYLLVRYASSRDPSTTPARLQIHAGNQTGPVIGQADLPGTGGWGNYQTIVVDLTNAAALVDAKTVSFTFNTPPGEQWVSNFDWFQFTQSLQSDPNAPYVLEAESWSSNSGGNLKNETSAWSSGNVVDVGGVNNNSWLDYRTVDFGTTPVTDLSVHYVNNTARCGTNSRLDVYLDAADPANPGTPFVTVPLAATGDNWAADGTTSIALPKALTGSHRLTIVNRSTTDASHPYVANLDNFTFTRAVQNTLDVQAETWQSTSGDPLKVENSNWDDGPVANVGGTYDGAWIDYGTVDFGVTGRNQVSVHYAGNSGRVGGNPRLEFYLDAADPAHPSNPIATVALPATAANWNTSGLATTTIPTAVTGSHRLSVVMRATTSAALPYVANLDKYTFSTEQAPETVDKSKLEQAIATDVPGLDRYPVIDAAAYRRELAAAKVLLADDAATQSMVDAQTRSLLLAAGQLVPKVRRQLENLVADAQSRTNQRYTDASWQTLQNAIAQANQVLADKTATDAALTQQLQRLQTAIDGLRVKAKTAPSVPLNVSAGGQDSALTVSWQAPADDGGSPLTGYVVRLADGHLLRVDDPAQHVATFSGLKPGQTYVAAVSAVNALGTSPASAWTAPYRAASVAAAPATATSAGVNLADGFPSDAWPSDQYLNELLGAFPGLPASVKGANTKVDRDQVVSINDKTALAINNAATTAEMNRAQTDADHSLRETGTDALGSRLGPIYAQALAAGELPQTKAVLDRVGQNIPGADAAKGIWAYDRPFLRLGLASNGGLIMDSPAGGYDGYTTSPSFPSGHTYGGYVEGTTLATLLPEMAPTILARSSEYGNNRIVNGFHYPLDVMGGRMIAQSVVAHRWADPAFAPALELAHKELETVLSSKCEAAGYTTIKLCAGDPYAGLTDPAATQLYTYRLDYGFPRVTSAGQPEIVPAEAAELLTTTFPELTDEQRTQILQQTALDSGTGLDRTADDQSSWMRVNLSKAMTATYRLNPDGTLTVTNYSDATAASIATLTRITANGSPIDGFDPATKTYMLDWPCRAPRITGTPSIPGATTTITTTADRTIITVTSANRSVTTKYAVQLHRTPRC
ncbi:glycoside hydrolase domain-containing protein [Kribbella speibonae]|uniref:Carbohydrate-binding protein n=1 Tax=Kribbella speibonae TaxID=1572660 RepID=A0ABY2AAR3_9ACTN|nr:glycoside hydrolase domain-containing protein [Kribbella speibonae]TCC24730.1 carbohydrate-binding protein [Kribbella speibonae]